jgi:DNA repair ATPase RecN
LSELRWNSNQLKHLIMGLFGNREKKIIEDLHKKSEDHCKEISKEIDELLDELKDDYEQNSEIVHEFTNLVEQIKPKLSPEDAKKLAEFSTRLTKVKRCARKGVEAMRELARDQRKVTRETSMEYQEYIYLK